MDRIIVYPYEQPTDTMFLNTNKNAMVGLGYLMQAVLGTGTLVDGLGCTPTSPASMSVLVATGSIYSLAQIDATAYGSVAADTTDQIVKQGIVLGNTTFNCPAPTTTGQSVVYLVEAIYQDVDTGSTTLNYYDAANPAVAWIGPNNTGAAQNTVRQGACTLALKTGVAATTGTQVTPTPDAGYTGLWAITVANGQTTITSGNIAQLSAAPFISPKLSTMIAAVQSGSANYAADTSGSANTITIALSPAVTSLTTGMRVWVKVANANTTAAAAVMNTNGLGNVAVRDGYGNAVPAGTLAAGGLYEFVYDGTYWQTATYLPGFRFGSYLNISANTTLNNTHAGKILQDTKTGGSTITLPLAGSYAGGNGFCVVGNNTMIATQGSDYCLVSTIQTNDSVIFVSNGTSQWISVPPQNGASLQWHPTDASGAGLSLTVTLAQYTRVGPVVFVQAYILYPTTADTNQAKLAGLPFPILTNAFGAVPVETNASVTAIASFRAGTSNVFISTQNGEAAITNSQLSGKYIIFSAYYFMA